MQEALRVSLSRHWRKPEPEAAVVVIHEPSAPSRGDDIERQKTTLSGQNENEAAFGQNQKLARSSGYLPPL